MGGSSSRELSRRDSKRKKEREKSHRSRQQEVFPPEHSTNQYEYNDSESRQFGYSRGHDTMTYVDNQAGFNQFQDNQWEVVAPSSSFYNPRPFYSQSSDDFNKLNSTTDGYEQRQFRLPIRRHRSFNERFLFERGQGTMKEFSSSRIRCNSLIDLNDRGYPCEGQYMGSRFTNISTFNLPMQNHPFYRSSTHSPTYDAQCSVGRGGTKRYSCSDYSDDVSYIDGPNGACGELLVFDSPVKPRVKRRQSDEDQSVDFLSGYNRNRNERSHSGLSFYSNSTSNSADSDIARSMPDGECGALDILSFPSEWSSYAVDKTGYVNISFSSSEGKSIQRFFQRTCRSKDSCLSISGIIRIENPFLHTLYLLKKEEMILRYGHVDELFLYHGTKKRFVPNICEDNLDWRKYSDMHRFGKGVSFSPSATYSSHYSDDRGSDKILMLFKVLVSKSTLGLPEMDIPIDDEGVSYDTSIKEDTSVIVKYCDSEFYPLYKILYKKL